MQFYIQLLGMRQESSIVEESIQKSKCMLLRPEWGSLIKLIEPLNESSPAINVLKQNSLLYHYCIEVNNIEEAVKSMRSFGAIVIRKPVPAALFNQRKIAFIYPQDKHIVELLEIGYNGLQI